MRKLSMDELNRPTLEDFKKQEKLKVTLLLDNVRSLQNVGSIFRTSDCFSVEKIILCGITGQPPHRDIERTALGATKSINWYYYKSINQAIEELKSDDYKIIAIEQADSSIYLNNFNPSKQEKYALIFGNEVNGVSEEAMEKCDACIEIPQFGTKHSFNIVVSAGIVLWDFYDKLHLRK